MTSHRHCHFDPWNHYWSLQRLSPLPLSWLKKQELATNSDQKTENYVHCSQNLVLFEPADDNNGENTTRYRKMKMNETSEVALLIVELFFSLRSIRRRSLPKYDGIGIPPSYHEKSEKKTF